MLMSRLPRTSLFLLKKKGVLPFPVRAAIAPKVEGEGKQVTRKGFERSIREYGDMKLRS
jgi:hypothetical protein